MLKREEGFSLIEITLALAVSALLMAGVISGISTFREDNTYTTQTDAMKNRLETIRAEALSGVTEGGVGTSSSSIFGKIVEFDPSTPNVMRVSTLIGTGRESDPLSRCAETSVGLGQMEYQGAERQAIVFRRQPDRVYAVAGPYTESASSCNPVAYVPEDPEVGAGLPPTPVPSPPPPIPWQGPPPAPVEPRKPLYQLWNNVISNHFYTTSETERTTALNNEGYVDQGITGYLYETQQEGSVPLYRMWSQSLTDHFYTTSILERNAYAALGYVNQGVEGYIMTFQEIGSTPWYRLWSPLYPDHFYTSQLWQKTSAMASFRGYIDEGVEGYIFTQDEDELSYAPQGSLTAQSKLQFLPTLSLNQSINSLLGIKTAHAINENILDPLNYADGGPFVNPLDFPFRLSGSTAARAGTITVEPASGGVTRQVAD